MASSPVAPSQTSLPDLTLKALPASSLPTGSNDSVETFLQSYLDAAQSLLASFDSSEGWKKGGSHVDGTVESFTRPKQEHPHVPVKGKHQANVVGRGDFWCARRSVHKESYEDFSVSFSFTSPKPCTREGARRRRRATEAHASSPAFPPFGHF
jgi:hypothetical protein